MAGRMEIGDRLLAALRVGMWGTAAGLVLLPLVAMQFDNGVNWSGGDFVFAAVVLGAACGAVELGARASRNWAYLGGHIIAVGTGLLMFWANAAVGIVGDGPSLANLLFAGVVALAILGSIVARLRAGGMARVMLATAALTATLGVIYRNADPGTVIVLVFGFAALWLTSAALFRIAERQGATAAA